MSITSENAASNVRRLNVEGTELYRPLYHFTPRKNWMNDPNGLVYFEGKYHMFFQYNPYGKTWGHMSWGHAVSDDLVHWRELPIAMSEREFMIFSGTVIVDWENVTGFGHNGEPPLIAFYTAFYEAERRQKQHVAFSLDRGRSWTHYSGNPILDLDSADFRDPNVFWHDAKKCWVMVVALAKEHKVLFYNSKDLLDWKLVGDFGGAGSVAGQWECPELVQVAVEGADVNRWLLKVDVDVGLVEGGSGAQYFIGDFDGAVFSPQIDDDLPIAEIADFGPDFYAAITWSDLPRSSQSPIWIGWMSNHQAGHNYPTDPWRGAMTVPRELFLFEENSRYRLGQRPISQLSKLRTGGDAPDRLELRPGDKVTLKTLVHFTAAEIEMTLECGEAAAGLVLTDENEAEVRIFVDSTRHELVVEREAPKEQLHPRYPQRFAPHIGRKERAVSLRILIDATSVEVFMNGGQRVVTMQFFPTGSLSASLFAETASTKVTDLKTYRLDNIRR